jgi:SAM-dependent methyltransferase
VRADAGRWNHNIHYHPVVLGALPEGCARVLDVGCGEGILARELRRAVRHVVAIDLDGPSIDLARCHGDAPDIESDVGTGVESDVEYVRGDFLTYPFEPASFDAVVSIAALHHMDAAVALDRMRRLLKPGGTLVVIGLARSRYPGDLPRDAVAAVVAWLRRRTKGYWEHSAPTVWPPPETFVGMRRLAAEVLPGVRYRRHLLWRYSLVWTKPGL